MPPRSLATIAADPTTVQLSWWRTLFTAFPALGEIAMLLFVIYLVMALQRAYSSRLAGAIGKAFFILIIDALCLLMGFVMVSVIALALP
jgi:hypothetical protein